MSDTRRWASGSPVPPRPGALREQHVSAILTRLDDPDAASAEWVLTLSLQDLFACDMRSINAV